MFEQTNIIIIIIDILDWKIVTDLRCQQCKISVNFFFRLFIYGLTEREKLITNIYILFRFDRCLAEKNAKQVG